jgi:hypothetical protein
VIQVKFFDAQDMHVADAWLPALPREGETVHAPGFAGHVVDRIEWFVEPHPESPTSLVNVHVMLRPPA